MSLPEYSKHAAYMLHVSHKHDIMGDYTTRNY